MFANPLIVGVDVGTTTIKAVAFAPDGRQVQSAAVPTPTRYPRPGWADYDADELWSCTMCALADLCATLPAPERIVSIAVASIGETGVLLDAQGQSTTEAIAWFDGRTEDQLALLDRQVGRDRLFAVTGLSLQPIFSLPKILWLREHRPDGWARARRWLNTADYIAFRLSGQMATDYSLACRTLAMNIETLCWDQEVLGAVGIRTDLMAPLADSGTSLGPVLPEIAQATGLPAHTVVGVGGHDHVCGAFALNRVAPGQVLDSMGTAEGIYVALTRPVTHPTMGAQGYSQGASVAGGYYGLGGLYTSGICVDWFRQSTAPDLDLDTLAAEAAEIPRGSHGVFFLPHLRLANPGYNAPHSRGAFVGVTTDANRGALYRAVLEGIALEARYSLEQLLQMENLALPDPIVVTGGGTRTRLLLEIKAAVFNRALELVGIEEATALGAALLGGVAADLFPSREAAAQGVWMESKLIPPDPDAAAWYAEAYDAVYTRLCASLYGLHDAIHSLLHNE